MSDIACVAWGSLIWSPGDLPVSGPWRFDGPELPLEFARSSKDGRLTLVIVEGRSHVVPTAWCVLDVNTVEDAAEALRVREGPTRAGWIGRWNPRSRDTRHPIPDWAEAKGLAAVVWAALPPKWENNNGRAPTLEQAVHYLRGLPGEQKRRAEEYIRRAPKFVRTPYRAAFENQLGWHCTSDS